MKWINLKKGDLKRMYSEYLKIGGNIGYQAFLYQIHNVGYDIHKVKNKPEYHKLYAKYKAKGGTYSEPYFRELCKKMDWEDIPLKTKGQATENSTFYKNYTGEKRSYSNYLMKVKQGIPKEEAIKKKIKAKYKKLLLAGKRTSYKDLWRKHCKMGGKHSYQNFFKLIKRMKFEKIYFIPIKTKTKGGV